MLAQWSGVGMLGAHGCTWTGRGHAGWERHAGLGRTRGPGGHAELQAASVLWPVQFICDRFTGSLSTVLGHPPQGGLGPWAGVHAGGACVHLPLALPPKCLASLPRRPSGAPQV